MLLEEMSNAEYSRTMLPYSGALKYLNTRLETVTETLAAEGLENPIEHVKFRLKSVESISRKLERKGLEPTVENAKAHVDDIAGMRIVCSFPRDICRIAACIRKQLDIKVARVKDYIRNPKENGYRSYHMHTVVPVYMADRLEEVKVEIQIRTVAMDFWATLEHKMRYKRTNEFTAALNDSLHECAVIAYELDEKMQALDEDIRRHYD